MSAGTLSLLRFSVYIKQRESRKRKHMVVLYSEDKKHAMFNGVSYCKDDKTGYYLNSTIHQRLHRAVYEYYNGSIPEGFHVHHKDCNRSNNEPENLEAIDGNEHEKLHGSLWNEDRRNWARNNLTVNARPKASEWHGSTEGREWHRKHGIEVAKNVAFKTLNCQYCGKEFKSKKSDSVYCSNACRAAARRRSGVDDEKRKCLYCGGEFVVNRYARKQCCCQQHSSLYWRSKNKKIAEAACL